MANKYATNVEKATNLEEARRVIAAAACDVRRLVLERKDLERIAREFHRLTMPRRKSGRKRKSSITLALQAWLEGERNSHALAMKYVPGYASMSRWRREAMRRRLMDAVKKRRDRDQGSEVGGCHQG